MEIPDPDDMSFMAKVLTAIIVFLLAGLSYLKGGKEKAEFAEAILTERPVSHAELAKCQIKILKEITEQLNALREALRTEFKTDLNNLYSRLNSLQDK